MMNVDALWMENGIVLVWEWGVTVSMDTSVALIIAKTASPFLRFIRLTEPVVMIEVTGPAAVLMTISETTLSDTICSRSASSTRKPKNTHRLDVVSTMGHASQERVRCSEWP